MVLSAGSRLGAYEILAALGAGGMGEVYRAHDTKLNRDVAIKVLPEEFARDPERIARFHREAQAVAALNHPNVAAIYEFAESDATRFLVLELVEGPTLAERLDSGRGRPSGRPIPIEETLSIATQICEALEAAHGKGIVHRDLKPANVKITSDGRVKVLDFGLAKALENGPSNAGLSNSPTLSLAGTRVGVILGTAAYMSPEQAKGFAADHRSDIFSFGCVLYEMLTGRQAFGGDTVSEILASVLKSDVDVNLLPAKLNPRIRELLRRCLAKNPKDRWHAAADVRVEIEAAVREGVLIEQRQPGAQQPLWRRSIPVALGMLAAAVIAGLGAWILKPLPPVTITRFPILLADGQNFTGAGRNLVAISPDGAKIAFGANERGSDGHYVPTGHIVYALSGTLLAVPFDARRLEVTGGPVPVVEGVRRGGLNSVMHFSFSGSGSLIYVPGPVSTSGLQRNLALSDRNGVAAPLKLPPGPYQFPRISPDGTRVAFETDDDNEAIVWIYDLDGTSSMRRLTFGGRNRFPMWSADGERVAFQSDREGDAAIFWQRADGTGGAERLTKPDEGTTHAPESWLPNGEHFLFRVGKGSDVSLWTFSLKEKKASPFGDVRSSLPTNAVFSPDGRWVAYHTNEAGRSFDDVFVQPFPATGAKYQLPTRGDNHHPLWLSGGKELFYDPGPGLPDAVLSVTTDPNFAFGNPVPATIGVNTSSPVNPRPFDVTPDGKRFIGVASVEQSQTGAPLAPQIQVVLNWFEDLKARVPVR